MAGLLGLGGPSLPKDQRDLVNSLANEFESLRISEGPRFSRYSAYREENNAPRTLEMASAARGGDYGTVARDGKTQRHNIPLPLGRSLVIKHSSRFGGRLPDAIVDRREESPEERYRSDTMEKMWWATLRLSGDSTVIGDGAHDGSELGATVFDCYLDIESQTPVVRALDPAGCIVVKGVDDPHDFQRVFRFWDVSVAELKAQYRDVEFAEGSLVAVELIKGTDVGGIEMVTVVEMCDRENTVRFALCADDHDNVPLYQHKHDLGFCPYVVIPNLGPYRDVWGWADYEMVRSLVAYIPAMFSREADVYRFSANGAYIERGTGQDAPVIEGVLSDGGVLPSRRDGEVEPIEPPKMPDFATSHAEMAMALFKMLGFAPDAIWGDGNAGSGSDRGLQLQPTLDLDSAKQLNWSAGLSRLASYCYRLTEKKQISKATYRGARAGYTSRTNRPFPAFEMGPEMSPLQDTVQGVDDLGNDTELDIVLPRSPKELFDKDYSIRFVWRNRIDPDDPAYKLAELNAFAQGAQSLETTLEHLGFQAPEDEIKRIVQEAEKFPWLRQGMIALIQAEIARVAAENGGTGGAATQGNGGGAPTDLAGGLLGALGMGGEKDGRALDVDAGAAGLRSPGIYTGGA